MQTHRRANPGPPSDRSRCIPRIPRKPTGRMASAGLLVPGHHFALLPGPAPICGAWNSTAAAGGAGCSRERWPTRALERGLRKRRGSIHACYAVGIQVRPSFPQLAVSILATDDDPALLARAARGCYNSSSLKDVPVDWRASAFTREGDLFCVRDEYRGSVAFAEQDIRRAMPDGPFHMILCRNVAFTYFAPPLQSKIAERLIARLLPGGALVVGSHEHLPAEISGIDPCPGASGIYQRSIC
jgi:CheR methyltransferase, SAM binding domain